MEINMSISMSTSLCKPLVSELLSCTMLLQLRLTCNSCRNLTSRQRALIEEFAKEEQGEDEKDEKAAGASG
jgi:hypothetical protein